MINSLSNFLNRMDEFLLKVMLVSLVGVVFLQVISRFILKLPIEWSEEIARFVFIWFCWLGASYATASFHHIRIIAQFQLLPRALSAFLLRLGDLLWITFNGFVLIGSYMYLHSITEYPYRAMITDIDMFWIFLPVPAIFLVFTYRIITNLWHPQYLEMSTTDPELDTGDGSIEVQPSEVSK